jgi:hypothetical protein
MEFVRKGMSRLDLGTGKVEKIVRIGVLPLLAGPRMARPVESSIWGLDRI